MNCVKLELTDSDNKKYIIDDDFELSQFKINDEIISNICQKWEY